MAINTKIHLKPANSGIAVCGTRLDSDARYYAYHPGNRESYHAIKYQTPRICKKCVEIAKEAQNEMRRDAKAKRCGCKH